MKRANENKALRVSRQTVEGEPVFAKYRFTWGDGCFFTMLVSTVVGPDKDEKSKTGWTWTEGKSDDTVTPDSADCWLWIRLANRLDFDPKYEQDFGGPQVDIGSEGARLGKWSIAFNTNAISNGETTAVFADDWWKEIKNPSCTGRRMIVIRYIIATREILAMHAPSITRGPAAQTAVCDPLRWSAGDVVPDFGGVITTDKIKNLDDIYQDLLKGAFKGEEPPFIAKDERTNVLRIGVMNRPLARTYGFKIDEIRKAALSELFNKGAWRLKYFERLGGEFKLNEPNMKTVKLIPQKGDTLESALQRLFASVLKQENLSGFAQSVKQKCDDQAKLAHLAFEEWVNANPATRDKSDASFEVWFKETFYLREPREVRKEDDVVETIGSLHPLHLEPFDLDVCKSAALLKAQLSNEVWMQKLSVEYVGDGSNSLK